MKINQTASGQVQHSQQKRDPFEGIPKEYIEVAESMEAQFSNHLLQEMRKTIDKENPDGPAMNYYNSLMDNERSKIMAKGEGSLGLKKVILDQIYPEHLRQKKNHAVKMYKEHKIDKGVL